MAQMDKSKPSTLTLTLTKTLYITLILMRNLTFFHIWPCHVTKAVFAHILTGKNFNHTSCMQDTFARATHSA